MMQEYVSVLKNYAKFDGRARRKEYWMFFLIHVIILVVLQMLLGATVAGDISAVMSTGEMTGFSSIVLILYAAYGLGTLIPSIAAAVRRLHDTGRGGLYYLLILIPCVGPIILIVFLAEDSKPGANEFGENPKGL